MPEAYIVTSLRTAGGRRNGRLSGWHPAEMAGRVLNGLLDRISCDPALIEDVIMGCVSQVGEQSANVARMAVLHSRLPLTTPGTTLDRQCGSSQQALHFAAQAVMSGTMDVVIAAGVESMSRVPMFTASTLPEKNGMGSYMTPQLQERFGVLGFSQFDGAEMIARKYGLSREQLDEYALSSHRRATASTKAGHFRDEILPLKARSLEHGNLDEMHLFDEGIRTETTLDQIASVKLLKDGGVISAANSSQICDGASGCIVANENGLKALGLKPMARIHQMTVIGDDPVMMLEAPIPATRRALQKAGLKIDDIDLFEINEAFASVPLAWLKALGADPQRMNSRGGSIAMGHPLGASGTKLMTTLLHALQQTGGRYGLQAMCEAGGMANAIIVENL
ncbi:acetyl-CoA C-acetyltransferase [Marinobacter sp. 71-i]|uniref:Acetyl-CoA C-acetyltransferase n=1 Tax=Marinobacter iranensis TaxID=2962607 RepID=A0ABT5YAY5_9GAMM|nr:acetyl-CoA C-acetyltransferase [Marinobacter iranensis]MDF0750830.1 acetyl-CoA C-acetyltransferase [Marinobacter iranensis]